MKYRKRPEIVEAMRLPVGEDVKGEFKAWAERVGFAALGSSSQNRSLRMKTAKGVTKVEPGDWIVKDAKGEFFPCKSEVFEATYELHGGLGALQEDMRGDPAGPLGEKGPVGKPLPVEVKA